MSKNPLSDELIAQRKKELRQMRKGRPLGIAGRPMLNLKPIRQTPPSLPPIIAGARLKSTVEKALAQVQAVKGNENRRYDDLLREAVQDLGEKHGVTVKLDEL